MQHMKTMLVALVALAFLLPATAAIAQTWDEITDGGADAGDLPGAEQGVVGTGSLTTITGAWQAAGDIDMYRIRVATPATWSATTAGFDTQIYLFALSGNGVAFNDDDAGGFPPGHSTFVAGDPLTSAIPAGEYLFAICQFDRDPLDGGGLALFPDTFIAAAEGPTGPGGANPIASWSGTAGTNGNTYTLTFTGVEFVPPPAGPEISVERPVGTTIVDGGTDNLGSVPQSAQLLQYTIRNTGAATLNITNPITFGPLVNCAAVVTTAPPATVAAAGSATFEITVTPSMAGAFSAPFSMVNDDADENPYDITVTGSALPGPITTFPYLEDFETFPLDSSNPVPLPVASGWTNDTTDGAHDWYVDSNGTGSTGTGPNVDHTTGTGTGVYLYVEDSGFGPGIDVNLLSPVFDISGLTNPRAEFWVHANDNNGVGPSNNTLHVDVEDVGLGTFTNDVITAITHVPDASLTVWTRVIVDLTPFIATGQIRVRLRNEMTGNDFSHDIAVDDFSVYELGDPEIDVQRPAGTPIVSGATDNIGGATTGTATNVVWTIENLGATQNLNVTSIAAAPSGVGNCTVTASPVLTPASPIAPSGTATFDIDVTPTVAGPFEFTITINNDDADEGTYTVIVQGIGVPPPPPPGSVPGLLYYRFNEGTGDTVANDASPGAGSNPIQFTDGVNPVTPTWITPGHLGAASVNNAGASYIDTGYAAALLNPSSWTIEFWIRTIDTTPTFSYIFGDGASGFRCFIGGFAGTSVVLRGGGLADLLGTVNVADMAWHHVAWVYDQAAGTTTLYIDGVQDGQNTGQTLNIGSALNLHIMNDDPSLGNSMVHDFDEFRLFGYARGGAQIMNEMSAELPQAAGPEIDVQRPAGTSLGAGTAPVADALGNVGTGAATQFTYTIENLGSADLTITSTTAVPTGVMNCTVSVSTPPTSPVAAGNTTTFVVDVTPTTSAAFEFTITINNDDADEGTYTIVASGTGVAPEPEIDVQRPAGTSIASGGPDALGNVGTGSATQFTYTIENTGTADLTITSTTAAPTGVMNCTVSVSTPPTSPVAAGGNTTFVVDVTPTAGGAFEFTITINNNDTDEGTYTVIAGGTGVVPAPEMDVQRPLGTSIADGGNDALGNQPFGVNLPITYTIENTGTGDLNITGTQVTATANANCTIVSVTQPTSPIAASGTATFIVTINITAALAFDFDISIENDDADENPYNFNVAGTGAAVPEIDLQIPAGTSVINGGTSTVSGTAPTTATTVTVTIANLGTAVLTLSANPTATAGTNCTASVTTNPTALTIAASSTDSFVVTVTPTAAGAWTATVTVTSDDADEGTYTITLSGTATISTGGGGGGSSCCGIAAGDEASADTNLLGLLLAAFVVMIGVTIRRRLI